jgi:hypothetical protein
LVLQGLPIHEAVTVLVRSDETDTSAEHPPLYKYFAMASLVTAENQTRVPDGVLDGPHLADSIHSPDSLSDVVSMDDGIMGSVSFPSLKMKLSGIFKLRITLMKMDNMEPYGQQGVVALQAIESECIQVTDRSRTH